MEKKSNSKLLVWVITIAIIVIVAVVGVNYYQNSDKSSTTEPEVTVEQVQAKTITYSGEDGKTVYDILNENYQVEADTSSFGVMVKSINGLAATDSEFWLYSVNGESGNVAADKAVTKSDDTVLWEYKGF